MEQHIVRLVKEPGMLARVAQSARNYVSGNQTYDGRVSDNELAIDRAIEHVYRRPVTIAVQASPEGIISEKTYQNLVRGIGFMQSFPERHVIGLKLGEGLNIDVGDFQFHVREYEHTRGKAA